MLSGIHNEIIELLPFTIYNAAPKSKPTHVYKSLANADIIYIMYL